MSVHVKVELSGMSKPLIPHTQTCGGFCCPKCGTPFKITVNEYVDTDGVEVSSVVHTPACKCGVPILWTPEGKP